MNLQRFRFCIWPSITVLLMLMYALLAGTERTGSIQAQTLPSDLRDTPRIVFPPFPTETAPLTVALAETAPLSTTFTYVGGYQTSMYADALIVSGTLAFITDVTEGVRVIDVSNPAQPQLLSTFKTVFRPIALELEGSLLAIADPDYGVYLVDMSNPTTPQQVGVVLLEEPLTKEILAIELAQNRLIMSTSRRRSEGRIIQMYTVSDPATPRLVGTYDGIEGAMYARQIIVNGNTMYLTGDVYDIPGTWLEILDITDLAHPQRLGRIGTNAQDAIAMKAIVENLVYLNGVSRYGVTYIAVVDVSNPAEPYQVGGFGASGRVILGLYASSGAVFIGTMYRDSTDPRLIIHSAASVTTTMPLLTNYAAPEVTDLPHTIVVVGDYLYIAENTAGLRIYRINYPYHITAPTIRQTL
jgi:hypothetical protein